MGRVIRVVEGSGLHKDKPLLMYARFAGKPPLRGSKVKVYLDDKKSEFEYFHVLEPSPLPLRTRSAGEALFNQIGLPADSKDDFKMTPTPEKPKSKRKSKDLQDAHEWDFEKLVQYCQPQDIVVSFPTPVKRKELGLNISKNLVIVKISMRGCIANKGVHKGALVKAINGKAVSNKKAVDKMLDAEAGITEIIFEHNHSFPLDKKVVCCAALTNNSQISEPEELLNQKKFHPGLICETEEFYVNAGRGTLGRSVDVDKDIIINEQNGATYLHMSRRNPPKRVEHQKQKEGKKTPNEEHPPKFFETGIKVIDLFCPFGANSTIGLFGEKGSGKTTLACEIMRNYALHHKGCSVIGGVSDVADPHSFLSRLTANNMNRHDKSLKYISSVFCQTDDLPGKKALIPTYAMRHARELSSHGGDGGGGTKTKFEKRDVVVVLDDIDLAFEAGEELRNLQGYPERYIKFEPFKVIGRVAPPKRKNAKKQKNNSQQKKKEDEIKKDESPVLYAPAPNYLQRLDLRFILDQQNRDDSEGNLICLHTVSMPLEHLQHPFRSPVSIFPHCDTIIVFNESNFATLLNRRRWGRKRKQQHFEPGNTFGPLVDPIKSTSKLLQTSALSQRHVSISNKARLLLQRAEGLKMMESVKTSEVSQISEEPQISEYDLILKDRALKLRNFLFQPLHLVETEKRRKTKFGGYVCLGDTLNGVELILNGSADHIDTDKFVGVGKIEDVFDDVRQEVEHSGDRAMYMN